MRITTSVTIPEIGVVIANHNNGAYVERAIESVAKQTLQELAVVVVDDASTDGSDLAIRRTLSALPVLVGPPKAMPLEWRGRAVHSIGIARRVDYGDYSLSWDIDDFLGGHSESDRA